MFAMRRLASLLALAFLSACSSSPKVPIIPPEVNIRQTFGPGDIGNPQGPIRVQFELAVSNQSSEALNLQRLEIESVGTGSYILRRDTIYIKETIEPMSEKSVRFWARAIATAGGTGAGRAGIGEPVTIRGVLYFDTDLGPVRKIFMKNLPQGQSSRD
jgi:hypothetical protein